MHKRLRQWFNNIPISDPIQRQLAVLIQMLLSTLLLLASLTIVWPLFMLGTTAFARSSFAPNLVFLLCAVTALVLLRRGKFAGSVRLVVGALLLREAHLVLAAGLERGAVSLLLFLIPITIAGLMLGRPALVLTIGFSLLAVISALALPPAAASSPPGNSGAVTFTIFFLVVALLGLLLDQVGAAFRKALADAVAQKQGLEREITERRRAEARLQESESKYRQLIEQAADGIFLADTSGNYLDVNSKGCLMLGYTRDELLQLNVRDIVLEADAALAPSRLEALHAGENLISERHMRRKDGTVFAMEASATMLANGVIQAIVRDITERKQAEAALQRANEELERRVEERTAELSHANRLLQQEIAERQQAEAVLAQERNLLRTLIDNLPDLIYIKDAQRRFILHNTAVERFVGAITSEAIHGKTVFDFFPPELAALYNADDRTVIEHGQPVVSREEPASDITGEWQWSSTTKVPLRNLDGEIVGLVGISRDITQLKRVEAALTHERNLLRTLIDLLPDTVFVKDKESRFMIANIAIAQVMGAASPEALLGKTDFDFYVPEIATPFYTDEQHIIATGQPMINKAEFNRNKAGVERWFLTTKVPLKNSQGEIIGIVGVGRDITERRQHEEKIRQLNLDLEQRAFELEATNKELEAFTYSVSHDLRAPLRAMDGFSRILLTDFALHLPSEAQRYLQLVRENAQQMGELINGLLLLSRLGRQALHIQPVAPAQLARIALDELRPDAENRQIEITIADLPPVQADPTLLKQVYVNLLQNALKFTRKRETTTIEIGCQYQDGQPVYFVKDNGVGFDMRYAHKLFGVFQRMHRAEDFEGTGIGLATVQRIVHRHGGRVWAESEIDRGAAFYFTLGETDYAP